MKKNIAKIFVICNLTILLLAILFYNLIPKLLNYGPEMINSYFETQIDLGYYYYMQFIVIIIISMLFINLLLISQLMFLFNWNKLIKTEYGLKKIQENCFKTPYKVYLLQLMVLPLIVIIVLCLTGVDLIMMVKIISLVFAFSALVAIMTYTFTKGIFKQILINTNNQIMYYNRFKFNLKSKIFFQIIPLFVVIVLFIGLFGYSSLIDEKGNILFNEYYNILKDEYSNEYYSLNDIICKVNDIRKISNSDKIFILHNYEEIYNEGKELSDFFKKYINIVAHKYEGHVYDYYGSDIQGTVIYINSSDGNIYTIGVIYTLASKTMLMLILISIILMFIISILYLMYFAKDISLDVVEISNYLVRLSKQDKIDYNKKLPVTSADEIGELTIAFNKILDLEKKNIDIMSRNQEIMVEQERLSSLGQLIGGIAHNLKTPIMSIAGAVEGLTDLIKEYDESIEDINVTKEDHHDIAKDMQVWVDKIRPYLSYMTEVIDTVKGQAVSMNATTMKYFSAKELIARTQILLRDELKRRHCTLNLNLEVDEKSNIAGEISAIVQVIDNLIINAMDAYKDNGGDIDIHVHEDETKIYIEVTDYAGGISEQVQDKLFKEMITSKGKNGTGLGLYMSYSTIRGKFNGDMYYKTEAGKGTTFFIELNKVME